MPHALKRHGLLQVAELAGVSLSTVDRVLNERGSVSDAKRRKVLAVARALGVRPGLPSPMSGPLRIDVLLVDSATDHFKRLQLALEREAQRLHPGLLTLRCQRWPENDPQLLLKALRKPRGSRQGLMLVAPDTPAVREALAAVVAGGTPTVLLTSNLSDLPGAVYVGIDNHAAGRCAGGLLSQSTHGRPGAALLVVNSLLYDAHRQRAKGFMEVMAAKAPGTRILGPLECFDNDGLAEIAVQAALQNTELVGIYDTGSSSAGIAAALRRGGARPTWVGHEANAQHAALLRDGALSVVLDQDPEGQVQAGIEWLLHRHGVLEVPPLTQLALRIVIEENLPSAALASG
ncbi:substrate-binding domain-containing protein [Pseudomonas sp. NPDC007930]|uniref:LacI family DNA-binding transcriptional regulator n=1 Tax=Pseudomonas sp. NPDC007930 TaxID=3364417 RepID=UPI0036F01BD1